MSSQEYEELQQEVQYEEAIQEAPFMAKIEEPVTTPIPVDLEPIRMEDNNIIKVKMDALRESRNAGLITEEEYEEKRRKLMDEI